MIYNFVGGMNFSLHKHFSWCLGTLLPSSKKIKDSKRPSMTRRCSCMSFSVHCEVTFTYFKSAWSSSIDKVTLVSSALESRGNQESLSFSNAYIGMPNRILDVQWGILPQHYLCMHNIKTNHHSVNLSLNPNSYQANPQAHLHQHFYKST